MYLGLFSGAFSGLGAFTDTDGKCRPDGDLLYYVTEYISNYYSLEIPANQERTPKQLIQDMAMEFKNLYSGRYFSFLPGGCPELDFIVKSRLPGSYQHTTPAFYGRPEACGPVAGSGMPQVVESPWRSGTREQAPEEDTAAVKSADDEGWVSWDVFKKFLVKPSAPLPSGTKSCTFRDEAGKTRGYGELESYARNYLDRFYNLRPVGNESQSQLKDRIVYVFMRHEGVSNCGATFDSEIGPVLMDQVVASISPLSTVKPRTGQQVVDSLKTPGPGKAATTMSWTELLKLFEKAATGWSTVQQQQAAAQMLALQNQGQKLQVTPQQKQAATDLTWPLAIGGMLALGVVGIMLMRD